MSVRTRFAPSPTGDLHIGNARTALFNWLFARHYGGAFILRVEDTDTKRSEGRFESSIMDDLRWLGLEWDEGPDIGGMKGPYRQSERTGIYRTLANGLLEKGLAYRCLCTEERLKELRERQASEGRPPRYDGRCRGLKDIPAGAPHTIRFMVPDKTVSFNDRAHGPMSHPSSAFGDFVIIGSDGIASYNFAVVVDDALMGITDIIRGDDHLANTPRQVLLFEALGFARPSFTHIPLVVSEDKTPLSKRDGSGSIRMLREKGYLPDALINAIGRLGWSFGPQFLTPSEMAGLFDGGNLSKSPSVFDTSALKSFNKTAIERCSTGDIRRLLSKRAILKDLCVNPDTAIEAVRAGASTIEDIERELRPFTRDYKTDEQAESILNEPYAENVIKAFASGLAGTSAIDEASYKRLIEDVKQVTGEKGKRLFMPIRASLTGRTEGAELVTVIRLLGTDACIKRLEGRLGLKKPDERG